ncbi:MAG: metallophosphoesterase [Treponemataceae bacterium]|nr:metallophosphoesterase [Treponemataceae bacterium]
MKILCVSDEIDPFIYNSSVKEIFGDVDAVLCAGDLPMDYIDFIVSTLNKPTYFVFGNHNLKEYKYYHKDSSAISYSNSIPAEATHGHGAIYAGFKCFADKSLLIMDKRTKKMRPLLLAGVSGCMDYNHGLCQYSEFEMSMRLFLFTPKLLWNKLRYGTFLDIFLTHASPRHIHDKDDPCHRGFVCFANFIKRYRPTFMVHGHIHLYDKNEERVGVYGETTVVNAYSHYVIEI